MTKNLVKWISAAKAVALLESRAKLTTFMARKNICVNASDAKVRARALRFVKAATLRDAPRLAIGHASFGGRSVGLKSSFRPHYRPAGRRIGGNRFNPRIDPVRSPTKHRFSKRKKPRRCDRGFMRRCCRGQRLRNTNKR